MLVDTHCHLDFQAFDQDRNEVLDNAKTYHVERIVLPGINLTSCSKVVALSNQYPQLFSAIGIHPTEAGCWQPEMYDQLFELANQPKVVAIGECGLDYYWEKVPNEIQKRVLEDHLKLASQLEKPVIIHSRDRNIESDWAIKDLYTILRNWVNQLLDSGSRLSLCPGVLHSFSYGRVWADKFTEMGFMIGITGPVTFKKSLDLQEIVRSVDLGHLLIETDSPFLTPHPMRGKRNQPGYVRFIAEKVAELRKSTFEIVSSTTTANAGRLFSW